MLQNSMKLSGFPADAKYRATTHATAGIPTADPGEPATEGQPALWFLYDYDSSDFQWILCGVRRGSVEKTIETYRSL
jgi:hypothetical protein